MKSIENIKTPQVSLWELFWTFFKTGTFTFGGGYAMISILEEELVARKKWVTEQDILDMIVIAESTPGVIAVNTATSVGYRMRGVIGAILATLGVVLPSFLIISGLSFAIDAFSHNFWYKAAFMGIQACVTVLVVNAFLKMAKQLDKSIFSFIAAAAAFSVAAFTEFNVIFLILIGAGLGIIYFLAKDAAAKKKDKPLAVAGDIDDAERGVSYEQPAADDADSDVRNITPAKKVESDTAKRTKSKTSSGRVKEKIDSDVVQKGGEEKK